MAIQIREANLADADVIVEYNALLAKESENKILDPRSLVPGVHAFLSDPHKGRYFVAVDGDVVVGQCSITYEWSDWNNGWYWWFQSVYVAENVRGRGVFRLLFNHVLNEAQRSEKVASLRLYVESDNHTAQKIYQHLGLQRSGYFVLEKNLRTTYTCSSNESIGQRNQRAS